MNPTAVAPIDFNPIIIQLAPYIATVIIAIVGFGLSYLQKKTGIQPQLIDQIRTIANEGINNEANKLVAAAGQSGITKVPVSNALIASSVQYVLDNAGTMIKSAGYTPDKVAQLVTSLMVSHPAVETPLNVVTTAPPPAAVAPVTTA